MDKLVIVAKLLVTFGLLTGVFLSTELLDLKAALLRADYALLVLTVALYFTAYLVGGIRWWGIGGALGYTETIGFFVRLFFISGFFSQFLVGGGYGGDVYRIWALGRKTGNMLKSFSTVFIDRASGLIGALLVVVLLVPVYWFEFPDHIELLFGISMVCAGGVGFFAVLAIMGRRRRGDAANFIATGGLRNKLLEVSRDVATGFLSWPSTVIHMGWSSIALLLNILAIAAIGAALDLEIGFAAYLSLGPIVFLAKSFPLSVAGWGTREVAMIYFFGLTGVDAGSALAMSILSGVLVFVASSAGGVLWFAKGYSTPQATI
ncbi:MAG: UPF0104 family protein [Proteobacteria bacterium]|nr:MAG: UPF0104 family protein [Pseudomonadota bacterium]